MYLTETYILFAKIAVRFCTLRH